MGQRLFALFLTLYDANGDDTVTLDAVWTILDAARLGQLLPQSGL